MRSHLLIITLATIMVALAASVASACSQSLGCITLTAKPGPGALQYRISANGVTTHGAPAGESCVTAFTIAQRATSVSSIDAFRIVDPTTRVPVPYFTPWAFTPATVSAVSSILPSSVPYDEAAFFATVIRDIPPHQAIVMEIDVTLDAGASPKDLLDDMRDASFITMDAGLPSTGGPAFRHWNQTQAKVAASSPATTTH